MGLKFSNTKLEKTDLTSPFVLDSKYSIEGTLAMKSPARLLVTTSASDFKLDYTKLSIDEKPFELAELPNNTDHYISYSRYVYRLKREHQNETQYLNDKYAIGTLLKVRYKKSGSDEVCELITSATSNLFIPIEHSNIQILRLSFYYSSRYGIEGQCGFDTRATGSGSSGDGSDDMANTAWGSRTGAFWAVVSVSDLEFIEILPILKVKTIEDETVDENTFQPHFTTTITEHLTINSNTVKQGEVWTIYNEYGYYQGIFAHYNPTQSGSLLVGCYPTSSEGASTMNIGDLLRDSNLYYKDVLNLNNNTLIRQMLVTADWPEWPTLMAKTNFSFK